MRGQRGRATIVTAKEDVGHDATGADPFWWQDAGSALFGKRHWLLELEVETAAGAPYRISGRFDMPNRLHKVRKVLDGPPRLKPGVVLPVVVDGSDPQKIEIDWKAFKAEGGMDQLYDDAPGVLASLKGFVNEIRTTEAPAEPTLPRPTEASHPAVEGIGYDAWIRATASLLRAKVPTADHAAFYEGQGFPPGKVELINNTWWERVKSDDAAREWYLYDSVNLGAG